MTIDCLCIYAYYVIDSIPWKYAVPFNHKNLNHTDLMENMCFWFDTLKYHFMLSLPLFSKNAALICFTYVYWFSFSLSFFISLCRSGLHTDIFLVLIVSITCVQTKEIKNSSSIVFQQISETHQNSSIEKFSSSTPSDSRSQNNAFKNHIWPTNPSINVTTAIASNDSVSLQRTQQKSNNLHQHQHTQRIQTNSSNAPRVKNFDVTYSIDNNDNISLHNELAQFELPTMITSSKFYKSLKASATTAAATAPNKQTFARNAKHSNILRSALRAAARQGFEAMVELYDKKEPNLISKGQLQFLFYFIWNFLFKWYEMCEEW